MGGNGVLDGSLASCAFSIAAAIATKTESRNRAPGIWRFLGWNMVPPTNNECRPWVFYLVVGVRFVEKLSLCIDGESPR